MKIGDKVRVVQEPVCVLYNYKEFTKADLSHLIGLEGIIIDYIPNFLEMSVPKEEQKAEIWNILVNDNFRAGT